METENKRENFLRLMEGVEPKIRKFEEIARGSRLKKLYLLRKRFL